MVEIGLGVEVEVKLPLVAAFITGFHSVGSRSEPVVVGVVLGILE